MKSAPAPRPAAALWRQYLATRYRVLAEPPFVLIMGRQCEALLQLQRRQRVRESVVITAWNPCSRRVGLARNQAAQRRLHALLHRRGHVLLPARAEARDPRWSEESVLVLGAARGEAIALARTFGQNALVLSGPEAVPRLLWVQPTGNRPSGR